MPGIAVTNLPAVEETMLIPLWARAEETARPYGLLRDPHAVRLVAAIDYDFERFRGAWKSQIGVVVRTRYIDTVTRRFIARHPGALVVNLGAGLDTRFERVDDGRARWFHLDTPAAADLRRRCLPPGDRQVLRSGSALDTDWITDARAGAAGPALVIAEGVMMFLDRTKVRALIDALAVAFPGGSMLMDVIGGVMVRAPWLHDTLPSTRARFRWGVDAARALPRWSDQWDVVTVRSMLDEAPERWGWMRGLRRVPVMRRQFAVAHLRFGDRHRAARSRGGSPRQRPRDPENGERTEVNALPADRGLTRLPPHH